MLEDGGPVVLDADHGPVVGVGQLECLLGAREADYVKGAETALDRARTEGWTVVSIKDDWATVF